MLLHCRAANTAKKSKIIYMNLFFSGSKIIALHLHIFRLFFNVACDCNGMYSWVAALLRVSFPGGSVYVT